MIEWDRYPRLLYDNIVYNENDIKEWIDRLCVFLKGARVKKVALVLNNKTLSLMLMLAALKCEICFIPINSEMPFKRIMTILTEHQDALVLIDSELRGTMETQHEYVKCSDCNSPEGDFSAFIGTRECKDTYNNLAYIIYTSGSSGVPKGVMIGWDELKNLMDVLQPLYMPYQRFVSLSKPSFDFFIGETLIPALLGKV